MTYFISMLLLLITLSSHADSSKLTESKSTAQKTTTQVPHNNGTDGLLKNTIMEPIENFNSLSKKMITQKAESVKKVNIESSATKIKNQQPIEQKTGHIKKELAIENNLASGSPNFSLSSDQQ